MTSLTLIIGNKNYSSWSLRPWLAMKQAGLDFQEVRIPLYTPESPAQIRQYTPAGKVPTLMHNHLPIWDSLAILEYLAETFPGLVNWPQDRPARALARSISAEMHSGFQALRQQMSMNCRKRYPPKALTPELAQDIDRIQALWQDCRHRVGGAGPFLFGDFTIADAMFAPVALRFVTYQVPLDAVAQAYVDAILHLPALQEWVQAAAAETETIPAFEY